MSAPEPTAEHYEEARALRPEGRPDEYEQWCQTHEGTDQDWHDWCVARALAAAEARGFERGKESAAKVADSVIHNTQMPWYVTKNNIVHAIRALPLEPR